LRGGGIARRDARVGPPATHDQEWAECHPNRNAATIATGILNQ
jgi:hypothetical protein